MENKNEVRKKRIDVSIKIILIILIIFLLFYNLILTRNNSALKNKLGPNGNVDIIDIECNSNQCKPIPKPNNTITSINFTQENISIKKGSKQKLVLVIKPSSLSTSKLTWTSSDESIATVDSNGVVTGIKNGKVTITVTSSNGISSTCVVNVVDETIKVNKIVLSLESLSLSAGTMEQLVAKIEPENATERELIWSSSDPSIATVDSSGRITGIKAGTVTITAKTLDGKTKANITIIVITGDGEVEVFDNEKDAISWNGSDNLRIFSKSIYNFDDVIAPECENTYQFVVRNNTKYTINYNIDFIETNNYNINMRYKLKKNDSYIVNDFSKPSSLSISKFVLKPGESDVYYLDWKWVSSSNDTKIGSNPEAKYELKIEVKAESVSE